MTILSRPFWTTAAIVLVFANPAWAQDRVKTASENEQTEQTRLVEMVRSLATRAEALRAEANFSEAKAVEAQIRELCRELDPRFVRGNELKRRALEARISGNLEDVQLYEREADRIFDELAKEFQVEIREHEARTMLEQKLAQLSEQNAKMKEDFQKEQNAFFEWRNQAQQDMASMEIRMQESKVVEEEQQKRLAMEMERSFDRQRQMEDMIDDLENRIKELSSALAASRQSEAVKEKELENALVKINELKAQLDQDKN